MKITCISIFYKENKQIQEVNLISDLQFQPYKATTVIYTYQEWEV